MQTIDQRPLILVVDDALTNIRVLAEALCVDYRVKIATNGKAALDIAANSAALPDLILLDIMMPEMDGYEVCRRLKQNPTTQAIPIIFVTAKADVIDEEFGLSLGAMDYIVKPFHLAIVKARVRSHINLKKRTDILESLALVDGLTGIPNRRRFEEALSNEWKNAKRNYLPISLVMADIDCFKEYNDNYGHGAGDQCLRVVAQALCDSLGRSGGIMARYGGEEFIAFLPNTEEEGARSLAERWRANVAALVVTHKFSSVADFVTVSVGWVTVLPKEDQSSAEVCDLVDKMLYQAKNQGRNRACGVSITNQDECP